MNESNSSNFNTTETLMGGTVRVSNTPASAEPDRPQGGTKLSGRYVIGQPEQVALGVTKSQGSDLLADARAAAGDSVLATARNEWGGVANEITPKSVVMIPGMGETSVATAVKLGYLRLQNGTYHETGMAQGSTQSAPHGAAPVAGSAESDEMFMAPEVESGIAKAVEGLSQSQFEGILAKAVSFGPESLNARELADQLQTTEADALARVNWVMMAYQASANAAVKATLNGNSVDDLWEWSADNAKELHKKAMLELTMAGSTASLKSLAQAYMKSVDPSDEALEAAGYPTKMENGTKLVRLQGVWVSLASATKNGWL